MNWVIFWDILDKFGTATGFIGLFVSISIRLYLWQKEKRDNDLIQIRLQLTEPEKRITLRNRIRRKNLTRAELLGLLGMLPMQDSGKRFALSGLSEQVFLAKLEDAQVNAKVNEVLIPCTPDELKQFNLEKLKNISDFTGS